MGDGDKAGIPSDGVRKVMGRLWEGLQEDHFDTIDESRLPHDLYLFSRSGVRFEVNFDNSKDSCEGSG